MADDQIGRLLERIRPLLAASGRTVVLERVASGGGSTRWFFCRNIPDVEDVLSRLRAGSRVHFFFDDRIRREPFSESTEQELWDLLASTGEVIFGTEREQGPELDVALLDLSDVSEILATVKTGSPVYYGVFPDTTEDGISVVTFTPPDSDGVVRPQPV